MTTPKDETTPEETGNSVLKNLREPFQALLSAGSHVGGVVTDFGGRLREDHKPSKSEEDEESVDKSKEEADSSLSRFKVAAKQAKDGLSGAKTSEDYRSVTATFAGHTEGIIRDLASTAQRAAGETKDSAATVEAREALNKAVASVRQSFDDTVAQVRAKRSEGSDSTAAEESIIDDLRARLDDLVKKAGSFTGKGGQSAETSTDSQTGPVPHMIDGEVISVDDIPTTTKDN